MHGERDKLLKRAGQKVDTQKHQTDDGKDRARALLMSFMLLLSPLVTYTFVTLAWFKIFHDSILGFMVVFASMILICIIISVFSLKWVSGKDRPWLWWLGFFGGQGAIAALFVGFFLYYRYLVYYYRHDEMTAFTNVAPAQDDKAFLDASMFLFTEDARLDVQRAVGYKSRWTGDTYCIAPIVDQTMTSGAPIYYWAVGTNCCESRASFSCDDAADTTTRSALVALEPEDIVRPYMKWAVRGSEYERYSRAMFLETATYLTEAAPEPTFVYWTKDPYGKKADYWGEAISLCFEASAAVFALLLVWIYLAAWKLVPKQNLPGVVRYAQ